MKKTASLLVLLVAALFVTPAATSAMVHDFPASIKWREGQPRVSMETMRGKMVVVLFFQSWCGKCNQWSPELLKQMNDQYADDLDVVLVALKTDSSSVRDAESYLEKRGVDLSKWVVGVDPQGAYFSSFNFDGTLFKSVVVAPDGALAKKIDAGRYYKRPEGKDFIIAESGLKAEHAEGVQRFIPADMSYDERLQPVVRAFEAGDIALGMGYLKRVPGSLKEDADKIKASMMAELAERLPALKASVEDQDAEDRYPAYKQVQMIAKQLRRTEVGDEANAIVQAHRRDAALKKEQKAEKAYQSLMQKASKLSADDRASQLKPALKQYAKAFEGTYFGRQAETMAAGM